MDNYCFLRLKTTTKLITIIDSESKPRYICFSTVKEAAKFRTYYSQYRSKYGNFPSLDLSVQTRYIKSVSQKKYRNPLQIENLFNIEVLDQDDIDKLSQRQYLGLFHCIEFNLSQIGTQNDIIMRAQNIDCYKPDEYKYVQNLLNSNKDIDFK